jgi:hypothetical protein
VTTDFGKRLLERSQVNRSPEHTRNGRVEAWASKSVTQRLKPSGAQTVYGTAEPVPFVRQSLDCDFLARGGAVHPL